MRNTFLEYKLKRVNKTNVEDVSGVMRKLGFEDLADKMDVDVSDMMKDDSGMSVSYTHLTLPTIYSV